MYIKMNEISFQLCIFFITTVWKKVSFQYSNIEWYKSFINWFDSDWIIFSVERWKTRIRCMAECYDIAPCDDERQKIKVPLDIHKPISVY